MFGKYSRLLPTPHSSGNIMKFIGINLPYQADISKGITTVKAALKVPTRREAVQIPSRRIETTATCWTRYSKF